MICDGKKTAREKEAYESQNRNTNDSSSAQFVVYRSGESQMHANRKGEGKWGCYCLPLTRPGDGYLYASPEQKEQVRYVPGEEKGEMRGKEECAGGLAATDPRGDIGRRHRCSN